MNKIILLALAAATSAAFAMPASAQAQDAQNKTAYKNLNDKAAADYKTARTACAAQTGNAKDVCQEEAKATRARAEADAVAQYRNQPKELSKARREVAQAEYGVAKARCGALDSSARSACVNEAKAAETAALADAKAGTQTAQAARSGEMPDAATQNAAGTAAASVDCDRMETSDKAACLARNTGAKAKAVIADTVITSKIKADLVRDPDLKAMDVHVETVKGVVSLSGFVPSAAEASKAEALARGVDGVTEVKSDLKVK